MASLGEYLKQERELRGVDLQEIADKTNIKVMYLQAMESDSYELLPAEPFLKGFFRAYARTVGIDPEEVVLRYKENVAAKTDEKTIEPKFLLTTRPPFWKRKLFFPVAVMALLAIVVFSLMNNYQKRKNYQLAKDVVQTTSGGSAGTQGDLGQKGPAGVPSELQRAAIMANPGEADIQRETIITADELVTAAAKKNQITR